jgi:hypothetical protein
VSVTSPPISNHLPFSIREALVAAAKLDSPFERMKAIEEAERRARALCPRLYQQGE